MAPRATAVCLVAVLVVSLLAAGSVPVEADDGRDDWWIFVVHEDDEDDQDDQDDQDDEDHEDDDGDEDDDVESETDEDGDDEHGDHPECDESDHDSPRGNDCDDEDDPGVVPDDLGGDDDDDDDDGIDLPIVQPTPTPTPTPTPAPTATPTVTSSPTPEESDEPSSAREDGDGDSTGAGQTGGDAGSTDGDARGVHDSSHEIGGFEAIRSITTNRSTIAAGEWVEIAVVVENVNDEPRSVVVELTLFGEVVAVERVTVPPEATERVRFVQKFDAAGTYHPAVAGVETTIRVEERPGTLADRTVGSPGQVGFGVIAALLAVVTGALAARRW